MKSKKKLLTKIACLSLAVVTIVLGGLFSASAYTLPSEEYEQSIKPIDGGYDYQYRNNWTVESDPMFIHVYRNRSRKHYQMAYLGSISPKAYDWSHNLKYIGWSTTDMDGNGIASDYAYFFTWNGGSQSTNKGNPNKVYYNPTMDCYFNSYEVRVIVHNENNTQWSHGDITIGTTCDYTETQQEVYYQSISFNKSDIYQVWVQVAYYNDNALQKTVTQMQMINVRPYSDLQAEAYNKGVAKGYQNGYNSAIDNSDQWSLWAGLNTVILAPITFVNEAFNFDVFGVNVASFIKMVFTLMIVVFVVVVICKLRR